VGVTASLDTDEFLCCACYMRLDDNSAVHIQINGGRTATIGIILDMRLLVKIEAFTVCL
jgi:hypothetical protein